MLSAVLGGVLAAPLFGAVDEPKEEGYRLDWASYITAHTVHRLVESEAQRRLAVETARAFRLETLFLEVYRDGFALSRGDLERVRDFFQGQGFKVAGGIATVPGGDFGVRANEGLSWFNWEARKTEDDLAAVMRAAAPVFERFIVDDFLCTGDTSPLSLQRKGVRSWSAYRRDLMTRSTQKLFVDLPRALHPEIELIIKFPQWYDRFHLFGYDVIRQPRRFDQVFVGTETRGAYTQRFGFVQPYEGFVNYRWLQSLHGDQVRGAWFDHGDCDGDDFIEQAWQTVLAGAPEIVLFNFSNLMQGHPGHAALQADRERLDALAGAIARNPVRGVPAYKPPHSDAGGDLYIMDFIGMLGIPLLPEGRFPADAQTVFLPTQAATDPRIGERLKSLLASDGTAVVTAGFLSAMAEDPRCRRWAGVEIGSMNVVAAEVLQTEVGGRSVEPPLKLYGGLRVLDAEVLLQAETAGGVVPVLTRRRSAPGVIYVLNTHTFSQADFDAVGEVLLAPAQLGLLELPQPWLTCLRAAFDGAGGRLDAPSRVTIQPLGDTGWFIQNYNREAVDALLKPAADDAARPWLDGFDGVALTLEEGVLRRRMPARSRWWIRRE